MENYWSERKLSSISGEIFFFLSLFPIVLRSTECREKSFGTKQCDDAAGRIKMSIWSSVVGVCLSVVD